MISLGTAFVISSLVSLAGGILSSATEKEPKREETYSEKYLKSLAKQWRDLGERDAIAKQVATLFTPNSKPSDFDGKIGFKNTKERLEAMNIDWGVLANWTEGKETGESVMGKLKAGEKGQFTSLYSTASGETPTQKGERREEMDAAPLGVFEGVKYYTPEEGEIAVKYSKRAEAYRQNPNEFPEGKFPQEQYPEVYEGGKFYNPDLYKEEEEE